MAIGALLIALTANIQVVLNGQTVVFPGDVRVTLPVSPVPIPAQTFPVLLGGGALGCRRGLMSVGLYLALGLLLPIYAQGASGIDTFVGREAGRWVLGATGGYLLGFLFAGGRVGRLAELGWDRHVGGAVVAMLLGNVVIYLIGVPWLMAGHGFGLPAGVAQGGYPVLSCAPPKRALPGIIFPAAWWLVGRGDGPR